MKRFIEGEDRNPATTVRWRRLSVPLWRYYRISQVIC
jgi:hypothetical protein